MDEPTKRAWSEPELIILVRGGTEEAVLSACKANMVPGASPNTVHSGCARDVDPCVTGCNAIGQS